MQQRHGSRAHPEGVVSEEVVKVAMPRVLANVRIYTRQLLPGGEPAAGQTGIVSCRNSCWQTRTPWLKRDCAGEREQRWQPTTERGQPTQPLVAEGCSKHTQERRPEGRLDAKDAAKPPARLDSASDTQGRCPPARLAEPVGGALRRVMQHGREEDRAGAQRHRELGG